MLILPSQERKQFLSIIEMLQRDVEINKFNKIIRKSKVQKYYNCVSLTRFT